MCSGRKPEQYFVDVCVGGANLLDKVTGLRIGNDNNNYIIALLKAVQEGWIPPTTITEQEYNDIKSHKEAHSEELVGFVGFGCSFKAKFFGGYARSSKPQNFALQTSNNLLKQKPFLEGVEFKCASYEQLEIPENSIIYCDIPYQDTTKFCTKFNHTQFWTWAFEQVDKGHKVFVSEYSAPSAWECVWGKKVVTTNLGKPCASVEKLFTLGETR